jgi:hypothetical protein
LTFSRTNPEKNLKSAKWPNLHCCLSHNIFTAVGWLKVFLSPSRALLQKTEDVVADEIMSFSSCNCRCPGKIFCSFDDVRMRSCLLIAHCNLAFSLRLMKSSSILRPKPESPEKAEGRMWDEMMRAWKKKQPKIDELMMVIIIGSWLVTRVSKTEMKV